MNFRSRLGALSLVTAAAIVLASPLGAQEGALRLAREAGEADPILRVGLDAAHRLAVESERPYRIVAPDSGAAVWRESYLGETLAIAEGGPEDEPKVVYRIQIAAFSTEERAEEERRRVEATYGEPAVARRNPDRGSWRVRLGRAESREGLTALLARVRRDGNSSAWIAEEPSAERSDVTIRLVDRAFESRWTGATSVAVVPSPGALLSVGGKRYRGIVEIRVTPSGRVRAIDWVGLEGYLRGVVPAEMGPEMWPQVESLKAQAIAARTYAWRTRGRFDEEGFDVCATPRCQVYAGVAAEHPLADRAIAATRGEILVFEGEPISALYTATCGGHTEDAVEIFPEEDAPYLKGVPCRAEEARMHSLRTVLSGGRVPAPGPGDSSRISRDLALLSAAGVIAPAQAASSAAADTAEIRKASAALARLCGIPPPATNATAGPQTLAGALRAILEDLGWGERLTLLLSDADVEALLREDPERASYSAIEARALAYLSSIGAIEPGPDGRMSGAEAPTWPRLAPALARIGESYQAFGLRDGVAGPAAGTDRLRVFSGKGDATFSIAGSPWLYSLSGGRAVATERLVLWPGDRIRFRTSTEGRVDFVELRPPLKGASDDRSSTVHSWEVRKTRDELAQSLGRRYAVGEPSGFRVVRRGVSGRIVEIEVTGTEGTATIRGFDIRTSLDLRESLSSLEIQRDRSGGIEAVVFAGKGWGHGVGLCQVGAYGMAIRGSGYREILAHYYPGTEIRSLSAGSGGAP